MECGYVDGEVQTFHGVGDLTDKTRQHIHWLTFTLEAIIEVNYNTEFLIQTTDGLWNGTSQGRQRRRVAAPNGSKGVDFPAFLAFICDAQDKCAMRRYTSKGPVECMARYHKGVVFLRPVNVAECAQPQEQEALGRFLWAWFRDS
eukprot:s4754_g3.t1